MFHNNIISVSNNSLLNGSIMTKSSVSKSLNKCDQQTEKSMVHNIFNNNKYNPPQYILSQYTETITEIDPTDNHNTKANENLQKLHDLRYIMIKMMSEEKWIDINDIKIPPSKSIKSFKKTNMSNVSKSNITSSNTTKSNKTKDCIVMRLIEKITDALDSDYIECLKMINVGKNIYNLKITPHILLIMALAHKTRTKHAVNLIRDAITRAGLGIVDIHRQYQIIKNSNFSIPSIWRKVVMSTFEKMTYASVAKDTKDLNIFEKLKIQNDIKALCFTIKPNCLPGSVFDELMVTGKLGILNHITKQRNNPNNDYENVKKKLMKYSISKSKKDKIKDKIESVRRLADDIIKEPKNNIQSIYRYLGLYKCINTIGIDNMQNNNDIFFYKGSSKDISSIKAEYIDIINKAIETSIRMCMKYLPKYDSHVDIIIDNKDVENNHDDMIVTEYGVLKSSDICILSSIIGVLSSKNKSSKIGSIWFTTVMGKLYEYVVDRNISILKQFEDIRKICKTSFDYNMFKTHTYKHNIKIDNIWIYSTHKNNTICGMKDIQIGKMQDLCKMSVCKINIIKETNINMHYNDNMDDNINDNIDDNMDENIHIINGWTGNETTMIFEMLNLL